MVQSVEDVVARWEARPIELVDTKADVDALIAAWRERGEALREVADIQWAERRGQGRSREELVDYLAELQEIARAALKGGP